MTTRFNKSPSGSFGSAKAAKPYGARPPSPNWTLIVVRALLCFDLLLLGLRAPLLRWADAQPALPLGLTLPATAPARSATAASQHYPRPPAARPTSSPPTAAEPQGLARVPASLATVLRHVLRPPGFFAVWGLALVGLCVLALEWLLGALLLLIQTSALGRQKGIYLRIRTPQAVGRAASQDSGTDLLRALHQVLPAEGALLGQTPWLALVLSARPDEPVELGICIVGGSDARRTRWAGAIRKEIRGLDPDAVVDECSTEARPDPLRAALQPGRVAFWQEYGTALPPHYPLRLHNDRARSDLLGPLAAALQARQGISYGELQLVLRPRPRADVIMRQGWRAAALRRWFRLKEKYDHAMTPDLAALETKLEGLVYDATVRHVVVAAGPQHSADARAELDEAAAVLGQYAARSGGRLQRLTRYGRGRLHVRSFPASLLQRLLGGSATVIIGLLAALGSTLLLASRTSSAWDLGQPLLVLPASVSASLPALLRVLLPIGVGLGVVLLGQQLRGLRMGVRLGRLRARAPRAVPLAPILSFGRLWRPASILGPDELSGLFHLPTPALGHLVRWLPCRHLPAPPHAFAGDEPDRLIIGHAQHSDGSTSPVGLTLRDGREGLAFTAPPGVGKTQLSSNLCDQLRPQGYALIDGKGDDAGNLTEVMRTLIPLEDEGRLVILDVLDAEWPIGLNPLAGAAQSQRAGIDQVLGQMDAIFARLDPETWGKAPRMKDILRKGTLLVLAGEPHPTIAHVKQALLDPAYRARLLAHCSDVELKTFWEVQAERGSEQATTSLEALISRFDRLLDSELTRYLFNQVTPSCSFHEAIANRWLVLIPVPHRALGGLAGPVGMLLFQAFLQAAFARPGTDQTRAEYGLVCDEFQVLVENSDTKDVRDALTQVRSFGIITIIANQLLAQLGDLADYTLTAMANRIIMQTQEPDASRYARHYQASGLTSADVANQEPREHQYARIKCRGTPAGPFSLRPLPWLAPREAAAAAYAGPVWQMVLPPDSPTPAFDAAILQLVYGDHVDLHGVAARLAEADERVWSLMLERWDAIRQAQREHILVHPGCIPLPPRPDDFAALDQAARPRVLAIAEYLRIRQAIAPAPAADWSDRNGKGKGAGASPRVARGQVAGQHAHFAELDEWPAASAGPAAHDKLQIDDLQLDD